VPDLHRQHAEQQTVDDRKDGGIRADTQGERRDGDGSQVTPVFAESKSFRRMCFTFDAAHRSIGRGDASVVDPRRTTTENRGK